ncbi:uncharacterized protein LOC118439318 [Folsomia candida]|uniref:uncharacterized protein LOC118439318 n=1 Tax=Folsomia candida TaxID=158441 RepID=UPI0016052F66|nr:uncharacterized protein LOC118439318 [Folsomia candida]
MTEKVKGEWMNPLIFWNNLQFISLKSNICDSDEAKYLRKYCYDWPHTSESWGDDLMDYDATDQYPNLYQWIEFTRAVLKSPLKSGKLAVHYCQLINPLPVKEKDFIFYVYQDSLLSRMLLPWTAEQFGLDPAPGEADIKINFSPSIKERLRKEPRVTKPTAMLSPDYVDVVALITKYVLNDPDDSDHKTRLLKATSDVVEVYKNITLMVINEKVSPEKEDKIDTFVHPTATNLTNNVDKLEMNYHNETGPASAFPQCSAICGKLSVTRIGSFSTPEIRECCHVKYNTHRYSGYCKNATPICSTEGENQALLYRCCRRHGFHVGECESATRSLCWHFDQ